MFIMIWAGFKSSVEKFWLFQHVRAHIKIAIHFFSWTRISVLLFVDFNPVI